MLRQSFMDAEQYKPAAYEELLKDIERAYGIDISKSIPFDKESSIIYSKDSVRWLCKSKDSETDIIFITGLYDYIQKKGFKKILKLYKTKKGKYYSCRKDGIYLLYDFSRSDKWGFSYREDGCSMLGLLSDFHKHSAGYIPPPGGKAKSCWGRWIEEYKKELNSLKKYKEQANNRSEKTPFEIMFLSDCGLYISFLEQSIDMLNKTGYLENVESSMYKHEVCLGSFKQSMFYRDTKGMNIRNLNKCRYDIAEKDVADLAAKLSESCSENELHGLGTLVKECCSPDNLRPNSKAVVKAFLLFPGEYLKVCSRYFKGSDKWSQGEYMDKLKNASYLDRKRALLAEMLG